MNFKSLRKELSIKVLLVITPTKSRFTDVVKIANKTAQGGLKKGANEFGKKATFEVDSKGIKTSKKNLH